VNRGDVVDVDLPELGRRPAVIVTRQVANRVPCQRHRRLDHEPRTRASDRTALTIALGLD